MRCDCGSLFLMAPNIAYWPEPLRKTYWMRHPIRS